MKRIVVLISGGGTNLQAIMDACSSGELAAEVVGVVSNRKAAYGLVRAENDEIPTAYFPLTPYRGLENSRNDYSRDLAQLVAKWEPDLVVLSGFMLILTTPFLGAFPQRIINHHPALPGEFAGMHGAQRTFEAWQRGEVAYGGCMVHYAIPEVDAGAVLVSAMVPILPRDTLETYTARLHRREHQTVVMGVQIALEALGA